MKISRARDLQTPLQRGSSRQAFTWVPRGWREGRCQRKHRRGLTARGIGGNKRELPPPHAGEESCGCPKPACIALPGRGTPARG